MTGFLQPRSKIRAKKFSMDAAMRKQLDSVLNQHANLPKLHTTVMSTFLKTENSDVVGIELKSKGDTSANDAWQNISKGSRKVKAPVKRLKILNGDGGIDTSMINLTPTASNQNRLMDSTFQAAASSRLPNQRRQLSSMLGFTLEAAEG